MIKSFLFLIVISLSNSILSQSIPSASDLMDKTINYHDPFNRWPTFNDSLYVVMTTPNGSSRNSQVLIDLPSEYFRLDVEKDSSMSTYIIDKASCQILLNGEILTPELAKKSKMDCERGFMYKNYYTYLYGLPMKLKDPGTNINYPVQLKKFKNKSYLVLKATYDKSVGNDIWYFYFDTKTYAMEIYQFFKTDETGKEIPDSGEYILLNEESEIQGIKMPKIRKWYYNKNSTLLGTDTLVEQ